MGVLRPGRAPHGPLLRVAFWPGAGATRLAVAGRTAIDTRISARRGHPQSTEIVGPALGMAFALISVGKSGMGHAHKRSAISLQQVDLDQARPWRHVLVVVPAETISEAVDRDDLAEFAARGAARPPGDILDQIKAARMGVRVCFGAHPAQDLLRIGQEGEDGGGRGRDLGLAVDHKRFIHWTLLKVKTHSRIRDAYAAAKSTSAQDALGSDAAYERAIAEGQPLG